ncbi:MAG: exopolyphosphatase / guanosine-5-triphosphate,3-diphosphate pyrophosphatase [Gaiellaceae bacterium]|nr:exopolyphosphatase / guanosine-5-triphosphate,3-diphosphate pyrophosphatase [Gaiellaceae bacterium]
MTRVAVVDLGTNSTRLLVADVDGETVTELSRRTTITRLGEGVDERRRLLPAPIARVRNCLVDYRREAEQLGAERALLIATSAVRDAENGEAFLGEIEWSYGFTTRLLSGDEEALLTFRGVTGGEPPESPLLVVDVGGGSTELVVGDASGVRFHQSFDVGSVRMTERFLAGDPPTADELERCAAAVREAFASVPPELRSLPEQAIGVAGTVTTLAALDLELAEYDPGRVHGHRIGRAAIEAQLQRLAALPLAERRTVTGLEPERAPVILGGIAIVLEALRLFGLDTLGVSEHDILDGAALEAARLEPRPEGDAPPGAFTCC